MLDHPLSIMRFAGLSGCIVTLFRILSYLVNDQSGGVEIRNKRGHVSIHEQSAGFQRKIYSGKQVAERRQVCSKLRWRNVSEKPAAAGEATKRCPGQRLPSATIYFRVYFCLTRVAPALASVAAEAAATAERSVNTCIAHLRAHLVISRGRLLPSSSVRPISRPRPRPFRHISSQTHSRLSDKTTDRRRIGISWQMLLA